MANLHYHSSKKTITLRLNSDLMEKAKNFNINLSALLEHALNEKLKATEARTWEQENKASIEAYNRFVSENGCLSDEYRD